MIILVDENIPIRTVVALRGQGHAVTDVRGTPAQGKQDDDLWARAKTMRALLITTDKGFIVRSSEAHHGILIIRLRKPTGFKIHDRVLRAMARWAPREWPGLTVVMRDRVQSVWRSKRK